MGLRRKVGNYWRKQEKIARDYERRRLKRVDDRVKRFRD